ncbi:MAG: RidA family protein [Pseudomonadota bacterium]
MRTKAFEPLLAIGVLLTMTALAQSDSKPIPTTTIVNPPRLYDPAPNGYSHAVVATDATRIAFIAGQGGEDASGRLSSEFSEQLDQAYANLRTALDAVGAEPDQVTKITTYVVDYDQSKLEPMTKAVAGVFGEALPAQTLVPVPRLAIDGMLFEVDAVAVLD